MPILQGLLLASRQTPDAGANVLVVNHALFFSDLALRMAGVNYLPKYDLAVLDEAHTVEDVAGDHFGLKLSEGIGQLSTANALRCETRQRHAQHPRRRRPTTPSAMSSISTKSARISSPASPTGRKPKADPTAASTSPDVVPNDLSPKLRDLGKHLKEMMTKLKDEEEISEVGACPKR
jgi:ATP-dependent DNA helicase DinG